MPVQSTTDAGRSLLNEALHWALPRLAIYVFGSLAVVVAFLTWAAFYTYVWPGKPSTIEAPRRPAVESQQRKNWSRLAVESQLRKNWQLDRGCALRSSPRWRLLCWRWR